MKIFHKICKFSVTDYLERIRNHTSLSCNLETMFTGTIDNNLGTMNISEVGDYENLP